MRMGDRYRNYKLSSGEEIIGKIVGNNELEVTLHRPMMIRNIAIQDPYTGEAKEVMVMRPWSNLSNDLDCHIPKCHIILESSPTSDLVKFYLMKLEREDVVNDLYNEMQSDPEQLEQYIKTTIERDLGNYGNDDEQEEESAPPPIEEIRDEEKVQMNFQIPPAMFLAFLLNGIVSINEDNEMDFDIEEFMNLKDKERKPRPRKKKRKNIEDYFEDWNPEP